MLSIGFDFGKSFEDFYNKFNTTQSGKEFLKIFGISRDKLDLATMSRLYFSDTEEDRVVDVNSNVGRIKSPNNYISEVVKGLQKLNGIYLLFNEISNMYDLEISKKCLEDVLNGSLYVHDLSAAGLTTPYCYSFSTLNVAVDGRKYGQLHSKPPKRSDSFIATTIESIYDISQELQGSVGLPDFLLNLAFFYNREGINFENDIYKVENDLQRIIHHLNQQFRLNNQSLFSNMSIYDRIIFENTFKDYYFLDGTSALSISEYFQDLQKIFIKIMAKKDPSSGLPIRFPIVSLNIYVSDEYKILDQDFLKMICEYNTEGLFNVFISKGIAKICNCCRLISDPVKLREYSRYDNFSNGGISVGSARVTTINFARIGKQAKKNKGKYFEILSDKMEECRKILKAQRSILIKKIESGYLKFFTNNWMNINQFFSTFGMNGLYESLEFMGLDLRKEDGLNFAKEIFEFVEMKLSEFSEEDHIPYNFEQIPAEGSASTLAKMDKVYFNDEDYPYKIYANQFIPLWMSDVDVIERAKIDGILCNKMSGGSISHLGISGQASPEQIKSLIMLAVESGLEHFALNPLFLQCENGHTTMGKPTDTICPQCQAPIKEHYTRVVGYFTPVSNWDKTRREEDFPNRVFNYLEEHTEENNQE